MPQHVVRMNLNPQQLALLERTMARVRVSGLSGLASLALREMENPPPAAAKAPFEPKLEGLSERRKLLFEHVMQPGTGKALEMSQGQVLRIEQVEGNQCVDFNAFNLHDYKEFMHTGRTRTLHGINPGPGDFLWSAPPRERAMMFMLADTVRCNDVLFPRCSANLYESVYGFHEHTNCHDIQAEAQREYGLTPDDVHDSFNLFMNTEVTNGRGRIHRQNSKAGDHVELLALMDLLAVPNVCGADIMRTSNFALKPIKLQVFSASEQDMARVPPVASWSTQRKPADFRVKAIKADRALARDPAYTPKFTNVPLTLNEWEIALSDEDHALLAKQARTEIYGSANGDALRDIVFSWWETRYMPA
jgi:uncharacterized protein YcgI (DUF1989 family)